jgi:hypothetical protein
VRSACVVDDAESVDLHVQGVAVGDHAAEYVRLIEYTSPLEKQGAARRLMSGGSRIDGGVGRSVVRVAWASSSNYSVCRTTSGTWPTGGSRHRSRGFQVASHLGC